MSTADDVLILGGGVIGLSIAYEVSRRGYRVRLIDIATPNQSASWAGAGILPPASSRFAHHPYEQLQALSYDLHAEWAERLRESTGIDNGYRRCGGLYVARTAGEQAALLANQAKWHEEGIEATSLTRVELAERFPEFHWLSQQADVRRAWWVPAECQIRNPWHLQALQQAAANNDAQFHWNCKLHAIDVDSKGKVTSVRTSAGDFVADRYVLAAGAWTFTWLSQLHVSVSLLPIRGQMLLFRLETPPFQCIVNQGSRYVVPREDGHVLAGSTEEEAGFSTSTTAAAREELMTLAQGCHPDLNPHHLCRQWAGLRPATLDGFPYIGAIPSIDNLFVAAGHFRSGLFLSTGTAVLLADCMLQHEPPIDLSPFRISRG